MTRKLQNAALTAFFLIVGFVLIADYSRAAREFYQPHRISECRR